MTIEAAIYEFMSSFEIPAYPISSVPDNRPFPYITYETTIGDGWDGELTFPANVWYRTESEAVLNAKVREIYKAVGSGGRLLRCDDGLIWLKRGTPWAQSVSVEGTDEDIKRRYLNFDVEFLTSD